MRRPDEDPDRQDPREVCSGQQLNVDGKGARGRPARSYSHQRCRRSCCCPVPPHVDCARQRAGWSAPLTAGLLSRWGRQLDCTGQSMLHRVAVTLNSHAVRKPLAAAVLAATTKNVAGDLIIQKGLEQREHVDWGRTGLFAAFGVAVVGVTQYQVLVKFAPQFFGLASASTTVSRNVAAAKIVVFDQLLFFPFVYLPAFFVMREFAAGNTAPAAPVSPGVLARRGLGAWRANLWDDLTMQW